ncbi:hypothetical protein KA344_17455 [bacterium]|nr:hypothetical protein [bacterium]
MVLQLNWQKVATKAACSLTTVMVALSPGLFDSHYASDSLYSLFFYSPCQAAPAARVGAPQPTSQKNEERQIVNFPKGFSIGTLTITRVKAGQDSSAPLGPAQGSTVFNRKDYYSLDANHLFFLHPEVLKDIPPDCLNSIRMRFSSFDDGEDGLCDKAMKYVACLTGLKKLNLDRSEVTDEGLSHAKSLVNLESMTLFSTLVKGKAFKDLTGLKKLHTINIPLNELTPDTYEYFSGYPKLTTLDVGRCHPNEQAIKCIAKCTNLTDLDISGNQTVNDRNIKYLTSLKQLKSLRLFGTNVSLNGLAQLKDLPLKQIVLPEREYDSARLDAVRKVFPQAKLIAKQRGKLKGNDEAIFAPLH